MTRQRDGAGHGDDVGPPGASEGCTPLRLLHRVGALVVVDKPAGMLVHNSAWSGGPLETTAVQVVAELCGQQVWPLHRLDRGTSGLLLFVTGREAMQPWRDALATGAKDYVAVVRGRTLAPVCVRKPLQSESGATQAAMTELVPLVVAADERVSLVAARIHSGRHHQVRRHLAHVHHPVCFDAYHGDSSFNRELRSRRGGPPLALHALSLRLRNPENGVPLALVTPPSWLPWALELFGSTAVEAALRPFWPEGAQGPGPHGGSWQPDVSSEDDTALAGFDDVASSRRLGMASARAVADSWPWPALTIQRPKPVSLDHRA